MPRPWLFVLLLATVDALRTATIHPQHIPARSRLIFAAAEDGKARAVEKRDLGLDVMTAILGESKAQREARERAEAGTVAPAAAKSAAPSPPSPPPPPPPKRDLGTDVLSSVLGETKAEREARELAEAEAEAAKVAKEEAAAVAAEAAAVEEARNAPGRASGVRGAQLIGFGGGGYAGSLAWAELLRQQLVDPVPIAVVAKEVEKQASPVVSELQRSIEQGDLKVPVPAVDLKDTPLSSLDLSGLRAQLQLQPLDASSLKLALPPELMSALSQPLNPPDVSSIASSLNIDSAALTAAVAQAQGLAQQAATALGPLGTELAASLATALESAGVAEKLSAALASALASTGAPALELPALDETQRAADQLAAQLAALASGALTTADGAASQAISTVGLTSGEVWVPLGCGALAALLVGAAADAENFAGATLRLLGRVVDGLVGTTLGVSAGVVRLAYQVSFGALAGALVGIVVGPERVLGPLSDEPKSADAKAPAAAD